MDAHVGTTYKCALSVIVLRTIPISDHSTIAHLPIRMIIYRMSLKQHARVAMSEVSTTPSAKPASKKRPRQSPAEKLKALQKKQAQLDAQIKNEKAKIKADERKQDTRRKIVAGAIALEHMEHDENFKVAMEQLLRKHVKDSDKHLFEI